MPDVGTFIPFLSVMKFRCGAHIFGCCDTLSKLSQTLSDNSVSLLLMYKSVVALGSVLPVELIPALIGQFNSLSGLSISSA